jgi:hypothetical protein
VESLAPAEDFLGYLNAQMPVFDADFAMGDQGIVGIDIERIVLVGVEFDHRAAAHAQQMVDRHRRRAEFDGDVHFNIV